MWCAYADANDPLPIRTPPTKIAFLIRKRPKLLHRGVWAVYRGRRDGTVVYSATLATAPSLTAFKYHSQFFETLNAVDKRSCSDFEFQEFCVIFASNKSIAIASNKSITIAINKNNCQLEYKSNTTIL